MSESDGSTEPISSWDPMLDVVRQRLTDEQLRAVVNKAWTPPGKPAAWVLKARNWVSAQPVTVAFWAFSLSALIGAIVMVVLGWPVLGAKHDYPGVVLAAASAVAFGSIVFSAVAAASTAGAGIAPGYTQVLLGRLSLWLTGLALIGASGLLFVFALFRPSRAGAVASALFAASMVGMSWISARRAIADSDPLDVARHASAHYRRITRRLRRNTRRFVRSGLPRGARKHPEAVAAVALPQERQLVLGFLRQLQAGVDSTAADDRVTEALMLFDGVAAVFTDYADDTGGQVGRFDGLPSLLISTANTVLDAAVRRGDSPAVQHVVGRLVTVGHLSCRHPDFAAMRSLVLSALRSCIDRHWDDDRTTVAPDCVDGIGNLATAWLRLGAIGDAWHAFDALSEVATTSIVAHRKHIATPAVGALVRLFPVAAALERHARLDTIDRWAKAALPIAMLVPFDPLTGLSSPTDSLMSAVTLAHGQSITLQGQLWKVPTDLEASADVAKALLDILGRALPAYGKAEQTPDLATNKGLSLLYAVALFACDRLQGDSAQTVAARIMRLVTVWVDDDAVEALGDPQTIGRVWSIMLAATYTAKDPALFATKAQEILDATRVPHEWSHPVVDAGLIVSFYRGLLIASGHDDNALAAFQDKVEAHAKSRGLFAYDDVADLAPDTRRVPRLATVHVTAPSAVIEAVDAWAVEQWPRFTPPPGAEHESASREMN